MKTNQTFENRSNKRLGIHRTLLLFRDHNWLLYLPRAHAQGVKQSFLSVVCRRRHENRQILSSRHLCVL